MSEKKHIATDRRRQKAKAEGRVVKSNDLTSAALLVIALVVLLVFGESLFSKLASWLKESLVSVSVVSRDNIYWVDRFGDGVARYLLFVLPLLGAMFIAVVLVHLLQTGLPLSLSRVKPDAKKLSLSAGLVRLFSIESLFRLVMASFKILFVLCVAFFAVRQKTGVLAALPRLTFAETGSTLFEFVTVICLQVSFGLLGLGVVDYFLQRWKFEREIMMTDQELREEMKESEAGREVMRKRQSTWRQNRSGLRSVEQSEIPHLVITSDANVAVALAFDESNLEKPRLLRKGSGETARSILIEANDEGVFVSRQNLLANALHTLVKEGQEVPSQLEGELSAVWQNAVNL
ncbi:EscU/YscU/HrcU family type III secretion system export apparatus switch protein [Rubripirellula sp.]|jgi:flagellar biosynthetic protein FlhB|nr:EscU/YscU/HrcU family type III secretion system export apparatus switch protein [Rubripirellula sp.]MDA9840735.1 EscU/YscU/HrcU family type III secretion system export apparatus switch protein [Rubripirellula sp.]